MAFFPMPRLALLLALLFSARFGLTQLDEPLTLLADHGLPANFVPADLDGDGRQDLIAFTLRSGGGVYWYLDIAISYPLADSSRLVLFRNLGEGEFSNLEIIDVLPLLLEYKGILAVDADEDGDADLVTSVIPSAAYVQGGVFWLENLDGQAHFGPRQLLREEYSEWLTVADIDVDGRQDVVGNGYAELYWLPNLSNGAFGPARPMAVFTASRWPNLGDYDGDGDLDAAFRSFSKLYWTENTDGQGAFSEPRLVSEVRFSYEGISTADVNADGADDLIFESTEAESNVMAAFQSVGDSALAERRTLLDYLLLSTATPIYC